MTNKEQYQKSAQKVIHLLAEASVELQNARNGYSPETNSFIDYEYYIESIRLQAIVDATLKASADVKVENNGDVTYRAKEF